MTPKEITPEIKANELINWFMDNNIILDESMACLFAGKVAYEIGRTHSLLDENGNFYKNFYAKVESICKRKLTKL